MARAIGVGFTVALALLLVSPVQVLAADISGDTVPGGVLTIGGDGEQVRASAGDIGLAIDGVNQVTLRGTNTYLGLGTAAPAQRMHLYSNTAGSTRMRLETNDGYVDILTDDGHFNIYTQRVAPEPAVAWTRRLIVRSDTGRVGIGTPSPARMLHVNDATAAACALRLQNSEGSADILTDGGSMGLLVGGSQKVTILSDGKVGIGTAAPTQALEVNGETVTDVLNITGGADLSEHFDVAGSLAQPGMVVCIDPASPGELCLSDKAYSKTVAGIISGAGGLRTGMLMGQRGSLADGKHPVALTGRVYCKADATQGPIKPGDLLTTSNVPGHAMAVRSHRKARGAILGKAMTSLDEGRGLVLVLVTLQ